jgi:TniQ
MSQIPWRSSVKHHHGEAIASLVIRLAPEGLLTPGELLRYHFNRSGRLPPTDIATDPAALKDLALIGTFDVEQLYQAAWRTVGELTEFLGRELPHGWFKPGLRRIAPGVMKADGDDPWIRNEWQIRGIPCDCDTGEIIVERCVSCREALTWVRIHNVYSCSACGY